MLVYGDSRSGNCYKIQLLCAELGLAYDWREVDILAGETRTPEFLAMNPNGKIPLLGLPGGLYLPESNAILCYLAEGTPLVGVDRWARAQVLQWLFFEQYSHEPNVATARFIVRYLGNPPERSATLAEKRAAGYRALGIMEGELSTRAYMAGGDYTLADIALYAYTHVAHEGGFDLGAYPAIRAWLARIESRPKYVPMQDPAG
ncbi:MAG: glutathione S-transferase family protein [Gammaproteobacteria bacterium]|nr:glutathione S-transferase family protein [Gammaproteobacteria bacterium]MDH4253473.1 glutathione S-transferase family protein [Gammaproteobacteria bacterium]MDH5309706.1 glutathione S-transferase family protein [Gammaproteobacteria bacterium]